MKFKTVNIYKNPAELIRAYSDEIFSDEIMDVLDHVNDFEPLCFLVINNTVVVTIDEINGDVIAQETIDEFIRSNIEYAREDLSDET